jgi:hypothetical protein
MRHYAQYTFCEIDPIKESRADLTPQAYPSLTPGFMAVRQAKTKEFGATLDALRLSQARKPSFIGRLRKAGL